MKRYTFIEGENGVIVLRDGKVIGYGKKSNVRSRLLTYRVLKYGYVSPYGYDEFVNEVLGQFIEEWDIEEIDLERLCDIWREDFSVVINCIGRGDVY